MTMTVSGVKCGSFVFGLARLALQRKNLNRYDVSVPDQRIAERAPLADISQCATENGLYPGF